MIRQWQYCSIFCAKCLLHLNSRRFVSIPYPHKWPSQELNCKMISKQHIIVHFLRSNDDDDHQKSPIIPQMGHVFSSFLSAFFWLFTRDQSSSKTTAFKEDGTCAVKWIGCGAIKKEQLISFGPRSPTSFVDWDWIAFLVFCWDLRDASSSANFV